MLGHALSRISCHGSDITKESFMLPNSMGLWMLPMLGIILVMLASLYPAFKPHWKSTEHVPILPGFMLFWLPLLISQQHMDQNTQETGSKSMSVHVIP